MEPIAFFLSIMIWALEPVVPVVEGVVPTEPALWARALSGRANKSAVLASPARSFAFIEKERIG